jgi:hypothetical protein
LIASKIEALRLKESIDDVCIMLSTFTKSQELRRWAGCSCYTAEGRRGRAVTVINYGLEGYFCLIAG